MKNIRVPYALSFYDEKEIEAVMNVLKSGSTMAGKNVDLLEQNISKAFGHKYGIMCNSGSSALTLALSALNLPVDGEVITPALTFATTVATQLQLNLIPVLVDSNLETLNIDVSLIRKAITKKTVALVIPDLMGNFSDWDEIEKIANENNLPIVHDSADTIGHKLRDKPVGTRATISTTSLYGAHIINGAGNGGMLSTSDEKIANKIRVLRSWGRDSTLFAESENIEQRFDLDIDSIQHDRKFLFSEVGYNLEGSEISAAFANVQFSKLDQFKKLRRKIFDLHYEYIKKKPRVFILPKELNESEVVWYAFPIILNENLPFSRNDLQIFLEKRNIQTRPVFAGNIIKQPAFKNKRIRVSGELINADYIMSNALVIGCHQGMDKDQVDWVHKSLDNFLLKYKI